MVLACVPIRVELRYSGRCDGPVDLIIVERVEHWRRTKCHGLKGPFLHCSCHRVAINQLPRNNTSISPERRCGEEHETGFLKMCQESCPGICGSVMSLVE